MLFNSFTFLLGFLPAALVIYRLADPHPRLRTWTLILLSIGFYGYWNPWLVGLLVLSILFNWFAAQYYASTRRGSIITAAIIANLTILGLFKYANFVVDNVEFVVGVPIGHLDLALPLGISFFTFHHVMYLVDLRRGRAERPPLDRYALYICFFPQAIAGPIARWSEVGYQFGRRVFQPGWEPRCAIGLTLVVIGLIEKTMLADPLGRVLNPIYAQAAIGPVPDGAAWLAIGFGFQVFFDFAGYSDVAIGLGLIFGIALPLNFEAPYRATSIIMFWQRWHITLSRFLRDYVFLPLSDLPLGGRRHRPTQIVAAVLATMALCGLWHGAAWNFVIWGTLHGVALVFAIGWRRYLRSPPWPIGWLATIAFVLLTSVIFRAPTLKGAWHVYRGLAIIPDLGGLQGVKTLATAALCAVLLGSTRDLAMRLNERPRRLVACLLGAACAAVLVQLGAGESYEFIYFQF